MNVLDALRKIVPGEYIDPLLNDAQSSGLIHSVVAILQKAADSVDAVEAQAHILDAPAGGKATATIRVTPTANLPSAVVVKAGSLFSDTACLRIFRLTADVTVGPTLTPGDGVVEACGMSDLDNVPGEFVSLRGETVEGTISVPLRVRTTPVFGCDLTVRQMTDATGGSAPALEALARDVGVYQYAGESSDTLRTRAWEQPDVVSPDAIRRRLHKLLDPCGVKFHITEARDFQKMCLSRSDSAYLRQNNPDGYNIDYMPVDALDLDTMHNEVSSFPFYHLYNDAADFRLVGGLAPTSPVFFVVHIRPLSPIRSKHLVLSDEAVSEGEVTYDYGSRSVCALADTATDTAFGCLSGGDDDLDALYSAAVDMLSGIKAGGVTVFFGAG